MWFITVLHMLDDLDKAMTEIEAYLSIRKHIFEPSFLLFETPGDHNKDRRQDFLKEGSRALAKI